MGRRSLRDGCAALDTTSNLPRAKRLLDSGQNAEAVSRILCRVSRRELNLNPRQARGTQQQRQFPGMGQVVVEETPDRLQDRYLLLGDSVGG